MFILEFFNTFHFAMLINNIGIFAKQTFDCLIFFDMLITKMAWSMFSLRLREI